MKVIAWIAAFLLLAGCGSVPVTEENYAKIQNGMTFEQVTQIMGKPEGFSTSIAEDGTKKETASWTYFRGSSLIIGNPNRPGASVSSRQTQRIRVTFRNGRVIDKSWEDSKE